MSRINIGGFNLNSDEIIKVSFQKSLHTRILSSIGIFGLFLTFLGTLGNLIEGHIIQGLLSGTVVGIFFAIFAYLGEFKFNNYNITVVTMTNGKIEKYQRTFHANDDFLSIYKNLKSYIK